jgi:hypothetical protein
MEYSKCSGPVTAQWANAARRLASFKESSIAGLKTDDIKKPFPYAIWHRICPVPRKNNYRHSTL